MLTKWMESWCLTMMILRPGWVPLPSTWFYFTDKNKIVNALFLGFLQMCSVKIATVKKLS